ncbi:MAG: TIGR04282 family arsenosugar biosynthesis glycosyltransferase [Flavobacteriales bacterium]|nr:TIGR04282 family arsenosugar biosynthesis glycosyltransferase [Flavobacteriales bacterium]
MSKNLLIIFVRNPELGKVKTRLAKTLGDKRALEIYRDLLRYTNNITMGSSSDKAVFYSHFIDDYDGWSNVAYQKYVQEGGVDLGARMDNAFELMFDKGYENVVIIGSDCLELTTDGLDEAFYALEEHDIVIGPAKDGGYYLLGMKKRHSEFFKNKKWSTENVFLDTLLDIRKLGLSYQVLDTLSDVDYEEDLEQVEA